MAATLIDTHCHLDDKAFEADRAEVFARAQKAGVTTLINPADSVEGSRRVIALAKKMPEVFAAIGIHPSVLSRGSDLYDPSFNLEAAMSELDAMAGDPKVVAVGEFGLDVKHGSDDLGVQKKAMQKMLELANKHELPIILHCRQAYDELAAVIKAAGIFQGVVHCFAGGPEELRKILDLGLHVAYGGLVTFDKKTESLREAVKATPLDRMLLETDAPYLTPVPRRGRRNEPAEVVTVAQFIAELRGMPLEELAKQTTANAQRLFALKGSA
jgi:TatD DNase family protein